MKLEVDVSELDKVIKKLGDMIEDLETNTLNKLVNNAAYMYLETVLNLTVETPRDTGEMYNSWYVEPSKKQGNEYIAVVINPKFYSEYVNYGHRLRNGKWWEGFHFVEIALWDVEDKIERYIQNSIEKILKDLEGIK